MFKLLFFAILLSFIIIVGSYLGVSNMQLVEVDILFLKTSVPLSYIIAISFFLGFFIAIIFSFIIKCFKIIFKLFSKDDEDEQNKVEENLVTVKDEQE